MARERIRLTDKQWSQIEPVLAKLPKKRGAGRPRIGNREVIDGILWVLKTGARWRDLPPEYPSPSTCWRRLSQWEEDETWLDVWRAFLSELDDRQKLKWGNVFMDASFFPAKKGATQSAVPRGGKVRSAWFWSTARVFLWECPLPPRHHRR
jgi:transposase